MGEVTPHPAHKPLDAPAAQRMAGFAGTRGRLLYGYDFEVMQLVGRALGTRNWPAGSRAIGVVRNGTIVAGCVYVDWRPPNVEVAFASNTPHWASRAVIHGLLSYPFDVLNVVRITAITDETNAPVHPFLKRLGFQLEGRIRKGRNPNDALVYGLLREEWEVSPYGRKERAAAAA